MIKNISGATDTPNGPERSNMFYLGLGASMREGMISYLYMLPLGGAFQSKNLPLPAVLGKTFFVVAETCFFYSLRSHAVETFAHVKVCTFQRGALMCFSPRASRSSPSHPFLNASFAPLCISPFIPST